MKTVLLAWELGRGLGHIATIRMVAARLKAKGLRTVAVVKDSTPPEALQDCCAEMLAAPTWPIDAKKAPQEAAGSSATLNDMLSGAGLGDRSAVRRILGEWNAILDRFRPDLVVAEFAPLAALAARGRIPLALVGNGYTLPPHQMPRFPLLHRSSPAAVDEQETLQTLNDAALALGLARLERLPELFRGEAHFVQTFELLDPYHTQRIEPVDGPLLDRPPRPRRDDADLIFVYLSAGYKVPVALLEALRPHGKRVRVHGSGLSLPQRQELAQSGAVIHDAPIDIAEILPSCGLVVHRGGGGVTSAALLAGVPQLILSGQIEQDLNGKAIARAGVGKLIEAYTPSPSISAEGIVAMLRDTGMAARAAALAARLRRDLADLNPALRCETGCLALLERMT